MRSIGFAMPQTVCTSRQRRGSAMAINQAKYNVLFKNQEDAKRALDLHNRRRNLLLTITGGFFTLMLVTVISGFLWNLGNGIMGASIVTILFFSISAFLSGSWIFDGWDSNLVENYEKARDDFNTFVTEES
jgi:hypothetical protein